MTETEQLKRNAQEQYVKERHEELQAYLRSLFDELNARSAIRDRWFKLEIAAFITSLITLFTAPELVHSLAFLLWMICLLVGVHYDRKLVRINGIITGVFKTLEIMGLLTVEIEDEPPKKKSRKKKESKVAAMWEAMKSKLRKEAYV